ncbi:Esterase [Burkholderiales bacterium 8X]|nr:Esterase [Burkholderiales bacterium 8X]
MRSIDAFPPARPGSSAFRALLLLSCGLLASCSAFRSATAPLETRLTPSACTAAADTLVVMLPGAYSSPDEFVQEGMLAAIGERRLAVDVLTVDAPLAYYQRGTVFDRLRDDVFAPARARYRSVWVLGISVGGLGALAYSDKQPGELAGIVALAPYLGERLTGTEISNAGGLRRWRVPQRELGNDERLWRRLQRYGNEPTSAELPPLYLGYGVDDRFAFSHRLLADALPPERVFTTPGGHDWPQWRALWRAILPTLPLPACAG